MPQPTEVTVTLSYDVFNEVVDLLQLMTVVGIKLWVQGPQPNQARLKQAFDLMADASMEAWGLREKLTAIHNSIEAP